MTLHLLYLCKGNLKSLISARATSLSPKDRYGNPPNFFFMPLSSRADPNKLISQLEVEGEHPALLLHHLQEPKDTLDLEPVAGVDLVHATTEVDAQPSLPHAGDLTPSHLLQNLHPDQPLNRLDGELPILLEALVVALLIGPWH